MLPAFVLAVALSSSCQVIDRTEDYLFMRNYYLDRHHFDDVYITKDFSVAATGSHSPNSMCAAAITTELNIIKGEELIPYCRLLQQAREEALKKHADTNKECWQRYSP